MNTRISSDASAAPASCLWPEVPPNPMVPEADVPCCSTSGHVFLCPQQAFLPDAGARIKETLPSPNILELNLWLSSGILGKAKVSLMRDARSTTSMKSEKERRLEVVMEKAKEIKEQMQRERGQRKEKTIEGPKEKKRPEPKQPASKRLKKEEPKEQPQQEQDYTTKHCYYCYEWGHTAANCPSMHAEAASLGKPLPKQQSSRDLVSYSLGCAKRFREATAMQARVPNTTVGAPAQKADAGCSGARSTNQ